MFRLSLKYRIAVVILTLEVAVMVLALGTTLKKYTESNQQQWAVAERVQLSLLSDLSRIALLTAEYDELQPYIEQAVADPHIERVLLVDHNNRVVVSSQVDDVGKSQPDRPPKQKPRQKYQRKNSQVKEPGFLMLKTGRDQTLPMFVPEKELEKSRLSLFH